jgi:hypothetical protein
VIHSLVSRLKNNSPEEDCCFCPTDFLFDFQVEAGHSNFFGQDGRNVAHGGSGAHYIKLYKIIGIKLYKTPFLRNSFRPNMHTCILHSRIMDKVSSTDEN